MTESLLASDAAIWHSDRTHYYNESLSYGQEILGMMPTEHDANCYNMKHKRRGKCVVFNHDKFSDSDLEERSGSLQDTCIINNTFKKLGFHVKVYDNMKHADVIATITKLSKEDHGDADCVCVIVLTHGGQRDMVWAYDASYNIQNIWKPFTADKCPSLAGKPKLFFIQACQGDQLDDGVTLQRASSNLQCTARDAAVATYKLPTRADFLIARSSVPGFFSWRHQEHGSWFIQYFCRTLSAHSSHIDLLRILTITARKVATERASYDDIHPSMHGKKQMPSIMSTLLRDVYFLQKNDDEQCDETTDGPTTSSSNPTTDCSPNTDSTITEKE